MSDLCRRSFMGICRGGVCVSDLCPRRVSSKSVIQECQIRSVKYECLKRVSSKKSQVRVCYTSVKQECLRRSVKQECPTRVSTKKCLTRVTSKSVR